MSKLDNVNSTDILDAITLGCKCMGSVFNADDNDIPFFESSVWPEACLTFCGSNEAHIPGRHINALLNAADIIDIDVNQAVDKHRKAAFFSFSGPLPLPLNRKEIGGPLARFCPHHVREGFHALYPLVKFRDDKKAKEIAEKSIGCILELWSPRVWLETR